MLEQSHHKCNGVLCYAMTVPYNVMSSFKTPIFRLVSIVGSRNSIVLAIIDDASKWMYSFEIKELFNNYS